jgi:hypothetical protein
VARDQARAVLQGRLASTRIGSRPSAPFRPR